MQQILSVVAAIAFSTFLGWLATRLMQRSAAARGGSWPHPITGVLAIACWGVLSFVALCMALSTTTLVRTMIVMNGMAHVPPFSAIIRTDPFETARLREAVSKGLDESSGADMQEAVRRNVAATLRPYLADRMGSAPDEAYLKLVPIVVEAVTNVQAMGSCVLVGDGDGRRLRAGMDPVKISRWTEDLVAGPRVGHGEPVDSAMRTQALRNAVVARGVAPADVDSALRPDASSPGRCQAGIALLEAAAQEHDRIQAARDARMLLRGFALPG